MGLGALRPGDPERIGDFVLVGRLGAGGMGVVYLAQGPDGQLVAVKCLREESASDAELRARFRREAAILLRVHGICTARVLAADVRSSVPFLVMEYVPGPTLTEYVGERGPVRGGLARGVAVGLAEALVAIHGAGIVHRDLKPGNVLLSKQGPKVIDFGIAQAADATALTRTGIAVGTPGYLAPEQIRGQAGPPADVFAWAATVAYAVTGRPPFGTGPTDAVLYRVLHEEPDLDGVPGPLRGLLVSALVKAAEQRPLPGQLLAELVGTPAAEVPAATAVGTLLATEWRMPETITPTVLPEHTRSMVRRRAGWWVAAAVVLLLLATAGILWAVLPNRGNTTASGTTVPPATTTTTAPTTFQGSGTITSVAPLTTVSATTENSTTTERATAQDGQDTGGQGSEPTPAAEKLACRVMENYGNINLAYVIWAANYAYRGPVTITFRDDYYPTYIFDPLHITISSDNDYSGPVPDDDTGANASPTSCTATAG